jgi:hypothetical protein
LSVFFVFFFFVFFFVFFVFFFVFFVFFVFFFFFFFFFFPLAFWVTLPVLRLQELICPSAMWSPPISLS